MTLSYQQELTLAITPKCTASISIVCNIFIIYEAYCDRKQGKTNPIQRSLVGMSSIDILASFAWFLSTWAAPKSLSTVALTAGNTGSCNFQGFLLQLAIGAPLYNCSLAMYYLLVIKYNWSNEMLLRIEKWTHAIILSFSIGTSIALLPLTQYNPIGTVCWVIGSPPKCGHSSYEPSNIPCDRGDHAYLYGLALFYGPLWICVLACITSMVVIYFEVRATHRRLQRYSLPKGRQVHSLRRSATDTASVATQAFLYSLSFFLTWSPSTIWSIAHWFNVESFYLDFFSALCEPLQGLWNALIFIRKRPSSQDKIRIVFHAIFPCWCNEPGLYTRDGTTNSGHLNHSRHRHNKRSNPSSSYHSRKPNNSSSNSRHSHAGSVGFNLEDPDFGVSRESAVVVTQITTCEPEHVDDNPKLEEPVVFDHLGGSTPLTNASSLPSKHRRSMNGSKVHFETTTPVHQEAALEPAPIDNVIVQMTEVEDEDDDFEHVDDESIESDAVIEPQPHLGTEVDRVHSQHHALSSSTPPNQLVLMQPLDALDVAQERMAEATECLPILPVFDTAVAMIVPATDDSSSRTAPSPVSMDDDVVEPPLHADGGA